jgi:hypothetical protein
VKRSSVKSEVLYCVALRSKARNFEVSIWLVHSSTRIFLQVAGVPKGNGTSQNATCVALIVRRMKGVALKDAKVQILGIPSSRSNTLLTPVVHSKP